MIFSALVFSSKCTNDEVRLLSMHSQYVAFFPSARHGPNTVCMIEYPVLTSMLNFTLTVAPPRVTPPSYEVYVSCPAVALLICHLSSSPPEFIRKMETIISLSILLASLADDHPPEAPCCGFDPPEVLCLCPELDDDFCCRSVFCGGSGVLKRDANSVAHLLSHRYRNPFCESCVKAKMRHFRSRTGAFKREVKTFGDLVTFDFVIMNWRADTRSSVGIYIPGLSWPIQLREGTLTLLSGLLSTSAVGGRSSRCTRMMAHG